MNGNNKIWEDLKPFLNKTLVPCIVCGGNDFTTWAKERYLEAKKCKNCGMISINPHFTDEGLDFFYQNYFENRQKNDLLGKQRNEMYSIDRDWVCNYVKEGTILDIGCSGGFFLNKFSKENFEREGIEIGQDAAIHAKENFNIKVYTGYITDFELPKQYDLVMMRGVIEHFRDPIKVLEKCSKITKKGGYLFITATPVGDAFAFEVYREKWRLFTPLEHIHFFTERLLTRVLSGMGFSYVAHHYQYAETPYADSDKDYRKIINDIILKDQDRNDEIDSSPPFPGSMITAIWKKTL